MGGAARPGPALSRRDLDWMRRLFEVDGSGAIEPSDAEALLRAQRGRAPAARGGALRGS